VAARLAVAQNGSLCGSAFEVHLSKQERPPSLNVTDLISRHQVEIERNRLVWQAKPLLRKIYGQLYGRILQEIDPSIPGRVVEIGSGVGNLKTHWTSAVCTDLFPNPWLDLVCDGYELPFRDASVSHLILFDVFHHLEFPQAFLHEARRVLGLGGRLLLLEPYISLFSLVVYGLLHPEPVGWRRPINASQHPDPVRSYYAAQGNATRYFFRGEAQVSIDEWRVHRAEAFSGVAYLLSGGFSRPSVYPATLHPTLDQFDRLLSRFPKVFAARCLVVLSKVPCDLPRSRG
jgi:SAM-dependent methyltransferase